jgi:hypothetical protein
MRLSIVPLEVVTKWWMDWRGVVRWQYGAHLKTAQSSGLIHVGIRASHEILAFLSAVQLDYEGFQRDGVGCRTSALDNLSPPCRIAEIGSERILQMGSDLEGCQVETPAYTSATKRIFLLYVKAV